MHGINHAARLILNVFAREVSVYNILILHCGNQLVNVRSVTIHNGFPMQVCVFNPLGVAQEQGQVGVGISFELLAGKGCDVTVRTKN
jgi:hypothetical protein